MQSFEKIYVLPKEGIVNNELDLHIHLKYVESSTESLPNRPSIINYHRSKTSFMPGSVLFYCLKASWPIHWIIIFLFYCINVLLSYHYHQSSHWEESHWVHHTCWKYHPSLWDPPRWGWESLNRVEPVTRILCCSACCPGNACSTDLVRSSLVQHSSAPSKPVCQDQLTGTWQWAVAAQLTLPPW